MLEVRRLCKSYGGRQALEPVSFALPPGQCLGLAGSNGSGKSTLLRLIAQLERPDGGDVVYRGRSVLGDRRFLRKTLGYVPQSAQLAGELTVRRQLALWQAACGLAGPPPADILDLLGLEPILNKPVRALSGGTAQRVSIALALLSRPAVLLMDEATAGLDRDYVPRLLEWLEVPASGGGKKRRGFGLLAGGAAAVVAVAALVAVGVSSMFASPKSQVEKALDKSVAAYQEISEKMGMPDLKKLSEDRSVSQRFAVELNSVNSALTGGYDLSSLGGLGLRVSTDMDLADKKLGADLTAYWDKEDLLSFQMLFDDSSLYFGSPQFTGGDFVGVNTETLGADLEKLGAEDVGDLSFNLFELIDIAYPDPQQNEETEKAVKEAGKALIAAMEVEKDGSATIDVNGSSTKTTAYRVVIPESAMKDYIDAMEDVWKAADFTQVYEQMLKAAGLPREAIQEIMGELDGADFYGELADGLKQAVKALGDVELDVYLSGGYVSAVRYEGKIQGVQVSAELCLGGGEEYADDLSLTLEADSGSIELTSTGDHTGKSGVFTDETELRLRSGGTAVGSLTLETSYEPKSSSDNLTCEISVKTFDSASVSLEMEGQLTTADNSMDLKLEDVTVRAMGLELCSLGLEYSIGPCEGMNVSVKSSQMLADMSQADLMELVNDVQRNGTAWADDMEQLLARRLPDELLWYLMYMM